MDGRVLETTTAPPPARTAAAPLRLHASQDDVEQGLARLVLSLVELIRQLLEREAIRQVEGGMLSLEQEERLGATLCRLADKMEELKGIFGLQGDDLNLDLGPLGRLF